MMTLIEPCKAMKVSRQHGRLYACFVDFRKASDTIPRNKLWEHLSSIGVQGKMLDALKSYYANVRVVWLFLAWGHQLFLIAPS